MHQQAHVKTKRVSAGLNNRVLVILLLRQTKSLRCIIKIKKNPETGIIAFRFKYVISILKQQKRLLPTKRIIKQTNTVEVNVTISGVAKA
jgi:hypothetical protein